MTLTECLAAELGADAVELSPATLAAVAVDGLAPAAIAEPSTPEAVSRAVAAVERAGAALVPRGQGTHLHVGNLPRGLDVILSTRRLARVLEHDAADMTVTVEAGVTLSQLAAALDLAGQWLPLDPPQPSRVTVGGLLAADLNGSLRFSHGKARDYLLGLRAVVGGGTSLHGGGRVVKNVAGYDLPKLLIGSFGSLGVIVEATLKVRPRPPADVWLAAAADSPSRAAAAALALLDAPLAPYAVDLCDAAAAARLGLPTRAHVLVRLGGELAEVRDQRDRLAHLLPGCAEIAGGEGLRDFALDGEVSCRLSLQPGDLPAALAAIEEEGTAFAVSPRLLAHTGSGIVRLHLDAPEAPVPFLLWLRFLARQRGGHFFVERLAPQHKREIDVWGESPAPLELHRRIKQTLDPQSVFSPGRFLGRL